MSLFDRILGREVQPDAPIPDGRVKMTEHAKAYMASAIASGERKKDIAADLKVNPATISRTLKDPEVAEMVQQFRKQHRLMNLSGAQRVTEKAWNRVDASLDSDDPKAFDLYTRGLQSMERIAASASGELKPAPAAVIYNQQANLAAEGQELLQALLAAKERT